MDPSERGTRDQRKWWAKTWEIIVFILTGMKESVLVASSPLWWETFIKT